METVVALPERPEAPQYLTADEAALWREVVATKPADWFGRDTQPILAAYCQAVAMHRALVKRWHEMDVAAPVKDIRDLVGLINKTSGSVSALATKLRLTQQSRYTPQAASTASKKSGPIRPWETSKAG
jgi:phage terminase small subunit